MAKLSLIIKSKKYAKLIKKKPSIVKLIIKQKSLNTEKKYKSHTQKIKKCAQFIKKKYGAFLQKKSGPKIEKPKEVIFEFKEFKKSNFELEIEKCKIFDLNFDFDFGEHKISDYEFEEPEEVLFDFKEYSSTAPSSFGVIQSSNNVSQPANPMNSSINVASSTVYNIDSPKGYQSFRLLKHKYQKYQGGIEQFPSEGKINYMDNLEDILDVNGLKYFVNINKYSAHKLKENVEPCTLTSKKNIQPGNNEYGNYYETIEHFYKYNDIHQEFISEVVYTYCLEMVCRLIEVYCLNNSSSVVVHDNHLNFVEGIYKFISDTYRDKVFEKFIISDTACTIKFYKEKNEFTVNKNTQIADVKSNVRREIFQRIF